MNSFGLKTLQGSNNLPSLRRHQLSAPLRIDLSQFCIEILAAPGIIEVQELSLLCLVVFQLALCAAREFLIDQYFPDERLDVIVGAAANDGHDVAVEKVLDYRKCLKLIATCDNYKNGLRICMEVKKPYF